MRLRSISLALFGLTSCAPDGLRDFDADGIPDEADCAPEDPLRGGLEVADDGIDQDCDGQDPRCDVDGDGAQSAVAPCAGQDCDDTNANRAPGLTEACNGLDDDCDGAVPANEADADADGARTCDGDCDDFDATRAPGEGETCDGRDNDCNGELPADEQDADGDGVGLCAGDCDDADPLRRPGAAERCDGLDDDCDGVTPPLEVDGDGDGSLACDDCDDADPLQDARDRDGDGVSSCAGDCADTNPNVAPGLLDLPDDGIDQDCADGDRICDDDGDGALRGECGGDDCDDGSAIRRPGAAEVCNGQDDDCDGELPAVEADADADGVAACEGDCADLDPSIRPGAAEGCDGVDTDCSGAPAAAEIDADGDGALACGDCDDGTASRAPGAPEACNGLDDDCDGAPGPSEVDADGDGALACGDCDDTDAGIAPGGAEVPYDGIDQDCDGVDLIDVDGDGHAAVVAGGDDCDDDSAFRLPGAPDPPLDGVDANCDGVDGVDLDGDGYAGLSNIGNPPPALQALLDCDDGDATLNLADLDGDGSSTCGGDCDDDDATVEALDLDGDGASRCGADGLPRTADDDCDDTRAAVHPGATEACDGLDDDCDGAPMPDEVDGDGDGDLACADCDDTQPLADTLDVDGDGVTTCGPDGVFGTEDDDCDDRDADARPGASDDPFDGIDANCDGVPGVDADGDGRAAFAGDCDDADAAVFSGATELCDSLDSDCDGSLVDGFANLDHDELPDCVDEDADGDSFPATVDCNDLSATSFPGGAEYCDPLDSDCDGSIVDGFADFDGDLTPDCVDADADADGTPGVGDCDDLDPTAHAIADDADCDGHLTADDCDDADPLSTIVADDADCDGVLDCLIEDEVAGMTFIGVCPGSFTMGCTPGQAGCEIDESPAHLVTLTRGFWISETEVTQGQWQGVMGTYPSLCSVDTTLGIGMGTECPVNGRTWWHALEFANTVSRLAGLPECYSMSDCELNPTWGNFTCSGIPSVNTPSGSSYDCEGFRLPSEAEWEFAARAGTDYRYAGGDDPSLVAWTTDNSPNSAQPVASLAPNDWGLYDMSGNVFEFVFDPYNFGWYIASPEVDPFPPHQEYPGARGGSVSQAPGAARVSDRDHLRNDNASGGIRLVRTIPD